MMQKPQQQGKTTLFTALFPLLVLLILLVFNVLNFGDDTLSGSNQMALLLASAVAVTMGLMSHISWSKLQKGMLKNIQAAMPSIIILLLIGSLAGSWLLGGIVPAMIYYGLEIIHPGIFLVTAVVVSSVVSVITGSSWSTIATIGVALIGIGKAMGYNEAVVAGAIISGAYFGDKLSPLSDTTNLAPAVAGTDLFTHIRYMVITTVPAIVLTIIIFVFFGVSHAAEDFSVRIQNVQKAIENTYNINAFLFLPPVVLIILIVKKVAPLPALFSGMLLGILVALVFQQPLLQKLAVADSETGNQIYSIVMRSMYGDIHISSKNEIIDRLFSTGGMAGMLPTVWLIITAMIFGGVMEAAGFLQVITQRIISLAKRDGSLITSTIASCIFFNLTASDQYIAIVVPGKMFSKTYRDRGLKPEVLSRTLEDGGTVTSVLVPWNTCGATQARILGVSTASYIPYAFFNILQPIIAIVMAYANYKIRRYKTKPESEEGN